MNTIIYEEKRGLINKVVKQNLNLTISEVIILDKLLYLNKNKINAIELKKLLQVQNSPVSSEINHFIELNLLIKNNFTLFQMFIRTIFYKRNNLIYK